MTRYLLDANVVIALTVAEHDHHERAQRWAANIETFALCPIVEGALLRYLLRIGESSTNASLVLSAIRARRSCEFWPDELSYEDVDLGEIRGYRQVTDAYLVSLAKSHGALLATLDEALAASSRESVLLIPV